MRPAYYVIDAATNTPVPAVIRPAAWSDFEKTECEHWQTSWLSKFIQQDTLDKYALELHDSKELVGLGAYRNMPEGILVAVEYIESSPDSNPTQTNSRKYRGIGAALLAFGIQLSIDFGYGGAIYLKAKTSELRKHYIQDFGAIPFSHADPFMLLIDGDAARDLFSLFLEEE